MVVICPKCKTKLKIPEKIAHHFQGEKGIKFKCPKCQAVLLVKKPAATAPEKIAPLEKKARTFALDRKKAVVAHADGVIVERIKVVLEGMGLTVFPFTDGVETMVAAMRERPLFIFVDVALPKIYGFEVIKRLRGRPETKDVRAILISSIYDRRRYRREPASLYGADDYIDEHEIERKLVDKVKGLLGESPETLTEKAPERSHEDIRSQAAPPKPTDMRPEGIRPSVSTERAESALSAKAAAVSGPGLAPESPAPAPKPEPVPAPPGQAPSGETKDVQVEKAKRLARTILADINLYSPEKVNFAVKNNNFEAAFATELKEGKRLYDTRIPQETREKGDFFREAIENFLENKKKTL